MMDCKSDLFRNRPAWLVSHVCDEQEKKKALNRMGFSARTHRTHISLNVFILIGTFINGGSTMLAKQKQIGLNKQAAEFAPTNDFSLSVFGPPAEPRPLHLSTCSPSLPPLLGTPSFLPPPPTYTPRIEDVDALPSGAGVAWSIVVSDAVHVAIEHFETLVTVPTETRHADALTHTPNQLSSAPVERRGLAALRLVERRGLADPPWAA